MSIIIVILRTVMNALKAANVIGVKACRVVMYKVSDIVKMHNHWNLLVPHYLSDLSIGKVSYFHNFCVISICFQFPEGVIDKTDIPQMTLMTDPSGSSNRVHPSSASLMSPTGAKVDLGVTKKKDRKNSHSGLPPLSDQGNIILMCVH